MTFALQGIPFDNRTETFHSLVLQFAIPQSFRILTYACVIFRHSADTRCFNESLRTASEFEFERVAEILVLLLHKYLLIG